MAVKITFYGGVGEIGGTRFDSNRRRSVLLILSANGE